MARSQTGTHPCSLQVFACETEWYVQGEVAVALSVKVVKVFSHEFPSLPAIRIVAVTFPRNIVGFERVGV